MTEEQAKTKWCPFARVGFGGGDLSSATPNRSIMGDGLNGANLCIASACMAWRRQTVMIDRATGESAVPGVAATGQLEERYSADGYCGLAGQPS